MKTHSWRSKNSRLIIRDDMITAAACGTGITIHRAGGISILRRGDVLLQLFVGRAARPVFNARRTGDWSLSIGPLHLVRGDWWKASAPIRIMVDHRALHESVAAHVRRREG